MAPLTRLEVDPSNEAMHAAGDALAADEEAFREAFGTGEVVLVGVAADDLLRPAILRDLRRLGGALAALPGVRFVLDPTRAPRLVPGRFGFSIQTLAGDLDGEEPPDPAVLEEEVRANPLVRDLLIGPARDAALFVVHATPRGDPGWVRRDALLAGIRTVAREFSSFRVHLAGSAVEEVAVGRAVRRDQALFLPAVIGLLAGILAVSFRSVRGVVLPLLAVGSSLAGTLGLYQRCGFALDAVTSLLTPVILVVSVSVAVHLVAGHREALHGEATGLAAAGRAIRELALPCLLTTATTAVGFLALRTSPIPAVRDFGTFAAVAVGVSLAAAFLLIPPVLSFLPAPGESGGSAAGAGEDGAAAAGGRRAREEGGGSARAGSLERRLESLAGWVVRTRRGILSVAALSLVVAAWFAGGLVVNTDLTRALGERSDLGRAAAFFEDRLGGAGSIDCLVRARDGRLDAPEEWLEVARLEEALESDPAVSRAVSAVDLLAASRGGLVEDPEAVARLFPLLLASGRAEVRHAVAPDGSALRLGLRVRETASRHVEALLARLEAVRARIAPRLEVRPTGALVRVATDSNALARTQGRSVLAAFTVILLMIGILFRSPRAALAALVPNAIPILWTYGFMGAAGVELSSVTSMIACVAIGLVVDNTIHLLARFLRSLRRGEGYEEAVRAGLRGTGRAVWISTAALVGGFAVGGASSFVPTVQFSLLTGLTLLFALACDLLVLPACLPLVFRRFRE